MSFSIFATCRKARAMATFASLVFFLLPLCTSAQDCIDWAGLPRPVADLGTSGKVISMVRSEDLLCVSVGSRLLVGDIDPAGIPHWLGEVDTGSIEIAHLAISGTVVAAALQYNGTLIIDISNPVLPTVVGTLAQRADGVAFAGNLLCLPDYLSGLWVYDVSLPETPVLLGSVAEGRTSSPTTILARDGVCWKILQDGTIKTYDLSDPTQPFVAGSSGLSLTPGYDYSCAGAVLQGDFLYLAGNNTLVPYSGTGPEYASIAVFGVGSPGVPVSVPVFDSDVEVGPVPCLGIAVDGTKAAVSYPNSVVQAEIVGPGQLTVVNSVDSLGDTFGSISQQGDRVFLGAISSVRVLDLSTPQLTPLLGTFDLNAQLCTPLAVQGSYVFLSMSNQGYNGPGGFTDYFTSVYDLSDPQAPVFHGRFGYGQEWEMGGDLVIGDLLYGLYGSGKIWNWKTGAIVSPSASLPYNHPVAVGSVVYDRTTGTEIDIWSFVDPVAPVLVGSFDTGQHVRDMDAAGNFLYLTCGNVLSVLDVTNPLAPVTVATTPLAGDWNVGAVADAKIALVGPSGLQIVDISDPLAPLPTGTLAETDLTDVNLIGSTAYVASSLAGTLVIDLGFDGVPVELGRFNYGPHATTGHVMVAGSLFAVYDGWAHYPSGVAGELVSLSPQCGDAVPNMIGSFGAVWDGAVCRLSLRLNGQASDLRLVARANGMERIIPWHADSELQFTAEDRLWSATPGQHLLYVVQTRSRDGGWFDLAEKQLEVPTLRTTLHDPVPNPFNPLTRLSFTLGVPGPISVKIYGVDGRLVQTLVSEYMAAGPHSVTWDGTDRRQRPMPAGAYFARLRTTDGVWTQQMMMLK